MKPQGNLSHPMLLAFAIALSSGAGFAYATCSPDACRVCSDQAAACIGNDSNEAPLRIPPREMSGHSWLLPVAVVERR